MKTENGFFSMSKEHSAPVDTAQRKGASLRLRNIFREGGIQTAEGQFDIIAANLRTSVLMKLMDELISKLASRGIAIFSGIWERELPAFLSFLEPYPLETLEIKRIRGWMTLVVRKGVRSGHPAAQRRPPP